MFFRFQCLLMCWAFCLTDTCVLALYLCLALKLTFLYSKLCFGLFDVIVHQVQKLGFTIDNHNKVNGLTCQVKKELPDLNFFFKNLAICLFFLKCIFKYTQKNWK